MINAGCREKKKNKYVAVGNALLPDAVQYREFLCE